jgi:zinc transporter ZupT
MEQKSTFLPALQYGILTGLAMMVFSLILFLAGVDMHSSWNLIGYVLFVAGLYWGMVSIREKQLGGVMSYGKAFGTGFWVTLFAAVLLGIYAFFYLKYINPSVLANKLAEVQNKILTTNPNISDADLQKALNMVKMVSTPAVSAVIGFVGYIISGTIFSLIIAIFAKREDRTLA